MALYSSYQPSFRGDQSFALGNPWPELLPPALVISNYLAGLPLIGTATGESLLGIVQQKIDSAIGDFETKMGTFLVKRRIMAAAVNYTPQKVTSVADEKNGGFGVLDQPAVAGVDYDMLEVPYDYTARRFEKWSTLKARHRPITSVENIVFALPPNFGILIVPQPWITADPNSGIVRIVPVEGAMAVTSPGAGMWLPFFTMGQMNQVPQFTQMSYTAGVDPVPDDMVDAVAYLAAAKVLEVYNAAFYPGVQSFLHSVDGFNQSVTLRNKGPFTDQIAAYKTNADDYMKAWRQGHSGVRMASLGR